MAKDSVKKSIQDITFTGFGNLIKLLPTGTVFVFQFLNPVLTNNGHCHTINKYLSGILIGLWTMAIYKSGSVNLSSYKLQFGDFVHAFFSLIVFAVLSLLDTNTVECFYPSFESSEKTLLMMLPPVIGVISGSVFMLFPNKRHGIGYPPSSSDSSQQS
ncbi:hypothetical protein GH714_019204 [Hevea brasiliensis]|uniref:DUF679 domain membrane protein 2 n=1 Tax=Hevea brasiliensis TaxID=3981 RepID=A0A6A6MEU8_HEVBR|nr:hypothetical protein GH714_019204 [Hevea brasiliensis]